MRTNRNLAHLVQAPLRFLQGSLRFRRSCRRRAFGCLGLLLLLLLFACGLLFWFVQRTTAQELPGQGAAEPLSVLLLIDNSHSMFEKNGIGSDPELLRLDAARLFISYLGVDDSRFTHECGVIFFGTDVEPLVPLTRLSDDGRREEMLTLLQDPPRMGWTDQVKVLEAGQQQLREAGGSPALVLLTDGKPEWSSAPTTAERDTYLARLEALGQELASADIPLFIILLANDATDADPEIAEIWQPVWEQMAGATRPGRFYTAREAADLVDIYHDIVVALTGSRTDGPIIQATVGAGGLRQTVPINADLARLTLVVSKSDPALRVTVLDPAGETLVDTLPHVRHAGRAGLTPEEVWVIDNPQRGDWTVLISGQGRVTVWKDYRPAPATPTPMPTSTATNTPVPTATATATPTSTPQPRLVVQGIPAAQLAGRPMTPTVSLQDAPPTAFEVWLTAAGPHAEASPLRLLDDGRQGDAQAGDGRYGGAFTLTGAGIYLVRVELRAAGQTAASWETRIQVEDAPTLVITEIPEQPRVGRQARITAEWQIAGRRVDPTTGLELPAAAVQVVLPSGQSASAPLQEAAYGVLQGSLPLTEVGAAQVMVSALARTDAGQQLVQQAAARIEVRPPYPYWIWGVVGLSGTLVGGVLFYRRRRRLQPALQGALRVLTQEALSTSGQRLTLDTLRRQKITVGASPADIVLSQTTQRIQLTLARDPEGQPMVTVSGTAGVLHNEAPLVGETPLCDRDIITLTPIQLRYENVRLRRPRSSRI